MSTDEILSYVHRWPLIVHMISICFCLGCSAIFHLCFIHSPKILKILLKLDYGGISILIMGSSYPPIMYGFACEPVYFSRNIFLFIITSSSLICFCSSLHPLFDSAKMRPIRGYMFIILGLSAALPFTYIGFNKSNSDHS